MNNRYASILYKAQFERQYNGMQDTCPGMCISFILHQFLRIFKIADICNAGR